MGNPLYYRQSLAPRRVHPHNASHSTRLPQTVSMNRTIRAFLPVGLALVVIVLNGGPAWGQLSKYFSIPERAVLFDTTRPSGAFRAAQLEIDPPAIDFGDVTIGGESCVTVTIRNTGSDSIPLAALDKLDFPFVPAAPPNTILAPGKEAQMQICFGPITTEEFHDTLTLENGDGHAPATLVLKGTGLKVTSNIGPVLQVVSVDFDTATCGTTKCRTVTIRNIGTDPMQVTGVDPIPSPFSGAISPVPVTVPPNEERTFTICYAPQGVPSHDSAVINFLADNRVPLSVATVFDISGSMNTPFGNFGSNRIAAANAAGRSFLGNLVNDPGRGIVDEGAVYRFGDTEDFLKLQDYTTDLALLQNAVPDMASAEFTCIYNAVIRVSAELETRNNKGRRVLVLLTDGENTCTNSTDGLNDAIAAAQQGKITVYTIGIGSVNAAEMTELAESTGGFFSEALNPADLLESYQRIANDLSKSRPSFFTLKGSAVAPDLEVTATDIDFDSVRVGGSRCRTFALRNTGDAPLTITSFVHPTDHFTVSPAVIPEIPSGDSVVVQVCFAPERLREIDSIITFGYTRCVPESRSVSLHGTGYDSVTVEIDGEYIARPGGTVTVPVRLVGRVPSDYNVDSLELVFGYNKTVLFPVTPETPLDLEGSPAEKMNVQVAEPNYGPQDATLTVRLSGGRLHSTRGDTLLARLNMIALHGNSMTSPIELLKATFADGNPKVGVRGAASFLADSLCFQEDRLIDASARFGPAMKIVRQEPGSATVRINLPTDGRARADLFDQLGGHAGIVFDERKTAGEYEAKIDLSRLPAGSYWLRLLLNDDGQAVLNVMVRN